MWRWRWRNIVTCLALPERERLSRIASSVDQLQVLGFVILTLAPRARIASSAAQLAHHILERALEFLAVVHEHC